MRAPRPAPSQETRAEIARRRLALLAASFEAELPPVPDDESPEPSGHRSGRIGLPHVRVLVTIGVAASVLLVWWLLSGRPETSEASEPLTLAQTSGEGTGGTVQKEAGKDESSVSGASPAAAPQLVIDVIGKVRKPGIVTVPKGSRVHEAIEAAGGLRGTVDTTALNMARELSDGEQILVGIDPVAVPGTSAGAGSGADGAASPGATINLNTATSEQLDSLPGIGPVTAKSILDWRLENGRFTSVDDLLDVSGIGDATLAELRDLVSV